MTSHAEAAPATSSLFSESDLNNNYKTINYCSKCDYRTTDSGNFTRHKKIHNNQEYSIKVPIGEIRTKYYLNEHIRSIHMNDKLLCVTCSFSCNCNSCLKFSGR